MCEFSGRLIAWMDGELPERDAAGVPHEVGRHLKGCTECREHLAAYRQASRAFEAYCDAVAAAETRRGLPRWVSIACGAAAIAAAAAIAVLLMLPRGRVAQVPARGPAPNRPVGAAEEPSVVAAPQATRQPAAAVEAARSTAEAVRKVHRRSTMPPARVQNVNAAPLRQQFPDAAQIQNVTALAAEPPIEFAIPADAMFPPGAVPEGMSFTADLTITADGSAQRLGLRPQLAGFERRGNQP
jgi:hypothetical protein